jgi:hypothetical protein
MSQKKRDWIALGATILTMIAGFAFGYFLFIMVM